MLDSRQPGFLGHSFHPPSGGCPAGVLDRRFQFPEAPASIISYMLRVLAIYPANAQSEESPRWSQRESQQIQLHSENHSSDHTIGEKLKYGITRIHARFQFLHTRITKQASQPVGSIAEVADRVIVFSLAPVRHSSDPIFNKLWGRPRRSCQSRSIGVGYGRSLHLLRA